MKKSIILVVAFLNIKGAQAQKPALPHFSHNPTPHPTYNRTPYFPLSPADKQKINTLIAEMTVEEKAGQLASFYPNGNTRLNIPHIQAGECLHGVVANGA